MLKWSILINLLLLILSSYLFITRKHIDETITDSKKETTKETIVERKAVTDPVTKVIPVPDPVKVRVVGHKKVPSQLSPATTILTEEETAPSTRTDSLFEINRYRQEYKDSILTATIVSDVDGTLLNTELTYSIDYKERIVYRETSKEEESIVVRRTQERYLTLEALLPLPITGSYAIGIGVPITNHMALKGAKVFGSGEMDWLVGIQLKISL